ncbi:4Fe-4S dicluster domain-containing protein [Alkaliphilus pronyensis]|uniref:4Fe-4S dicluster domain-containing protein n=1 Tax=Alkaliphilus pronyensis TaxID=1482732 RepID=A0A6I0F4X4_9FIRM|nr:EFR1 family ferrodoxin [Alkaliphilus pronyensis]KAB3530766.1 4Fe-4S dicluster domain-containing protein [Alkaliphilus pronyensis]
MSKNLIYYFSGTGNSLAAAQALYEGLGDTKLIPVLSLDMEGTLEISDETETVGLVYPIYMNALPKVIRQFISKLKPRSGCYFYAVATHGGIPGMAGSYLLNTVKEMGIELNGYFEVTMINNTPKGVAPKPLMNLNWEKIIDKDSINDMKKRFEKQVPSIISAIKSKDTQSIKVLQDKSRGLIYHLIKLSWKINEYSNPKLSFLLDKTCTGCGFCEKVCPSYRVVMVEKKPVWSHNNCYYCYACFNFCPEQAIGVKHYEKKLGRYNHPDISWKHIANQKKNQV